MQKIKGDMLANRWVKRSLESKARVVAQLRGMINEMRGIPCPKRGVSNVDGGPIHDVRVPDIHGLSRVSTNSTNG
jgi:hypothetical protein